MVAQRKHMKVARNAHRVQPRIDLYAPHRRDSVGIAVHEEHGACARVKLEFGEDDVLGAVADLAARCCVLNQMQGEKALVNTHGIVLLDWRELSAEWIPQTLEAMREVFPRIQFIVATGLETLADRTVKIR